MSSFIFVYTNTNGILSPFDQMHLGPSAACLCKEWRASIIKNGSAPRAIGGALMRSLLHWQVMSSGVNLVRGLWQWRRESSRAGGWMLGQELLHNLRGRDSNPPRTPLEKEMDVHLCVCVVYQSSVVCV